MRFNFALFLLALAVVIGAGGSFLAAYLGIFKGVEIREIESPGFTVLYKAHTGPYHQIVNTLVEIEKWAKEKGIACDKTFGEFLDDPNKTEEARLRANAGCWLGEGVIPVSVPLPNDILVKSISPGPMVEGIFAGSPAIGPWKVYPQMKGYMADHHLQMAGPTFEIYTVLNQKDMVTRYLFPSTAIKNP